MKESLLIKGNRILREKEARLKFGNPSHPTWYRWQKTGVVPASIQIGPNSVGWLESELDEHLKKLQIERDKKAKGPK